MAMFQPGLMSCVGPILGVEWDLVGNRVGTLSLNCLLLVKIVTQLCTLGPVMCDI